MRDPLAEPAPAKVNLALHVTGRRADGYHLLDTAVVFTRAGDRLLVTPAAQDGFAISGPFGRELDADGDNLVLKARDLFRRLHPAHARRCVSILLEKNLPVASGIGGGSSDAAATLRALHRLHGLPVDDPGIAGAAQSLGADLPMCLAAVTLRAGGTGEIVEPVLGWPSLDLVLVNPGVAVATPAVFAGLGQRENPPLPAFPARADLPTIVSWLAATRNDLEAAARTVAPEIDAALEALQATGAALARMSGSGATCFGIHASPGEAAKAAATIAAAHPAWYVEATRTIERSDHAP